MTIIWFGAGTGEENPLDVMLGQQADIFGLVLWIAFGAAQHKEIAMFAGLDLGPGDHLGEEVVTEIGGDQTERAGAFGRQATSEGTGLISQTSDDLLYPLARFGRDVRTVVDDTRNSLGGNTRLVRDFRDR